MQFVNLTAAFAVAHTPPPTILFMWHISFRIPCHGELMFGEATD